MSFDGNTDITGKNNFRKNKNCLSLNHSICDKKTIKICQLITFIKVWEFGRSYIYFNFVLFNLYLYISGGQIFLGTPPHHAWCWDIRGIWCLWDGEQKTNTNTQKLQFLYYIVYWRLNDSDSHISQSSFEIIQLMISRFLLKNIYICLKVIMKEHYIAVWLMLAQYNELFDLSYILPCFINKIDIKITVWFRFVKFSSK